MPQVLFRTGQGLSRALSTSVYTQQGRVQYLDIFGVRDLPNTKHQKRPSNPTPDLKIDGGIAPLTHMTTQSTDPRAWKNAKGHMAGQYASVPGFKRQPKTDMDAIMDGRKDVEEVQASKIMNFLQRRVYWFLERKWLGQESGRKITHDPWATSKKMVKKKKCRHQNPKWNVLFHNSRNCWVCFWWIQG